jgi:hypothetical protein
MGFLSKLFGLNNKQVPMIPKMTTIMPAIAVNEIRAGRLPQLNTNTIILGKNELCRFVDQASLIMDRTSTHYEGRSSGVSFRIIRGVYYRIGQSRGTPVKTKTQEYENGVLYITDRRVIFVAQSNGFEIALKDITAIVNYTDAIGLQVGGRSYNILLPQSDIAAQTIRILT